jgi:hypothetical protein
VILTRNRQIERFPEVAMSLFYGNIESPRRT